MKALIIGHSGQDGELLYGQLLERGYDLVGFDGMTFQSNCPPAPGENPDVLDHGHMARLFASFAPDEVYYLAAYNFSSEDNPDGSSDALFDNNRRIHLDGLLNVLEAMRQHSPHSRLFYAGSSLMFGDSGGVPQNEDTPLEPEGFYGVTKAAGAMLCREYRRHYGLYATVGILYNHESVLRTPNYLSARLIRQAIQIKRGELDKMTVGNPSAAVDWGYAPDYVDAFQRILGLEQPEDFVVATGRLHTVQEFIDTVFACLDLDPAGKVVVDGGILSREHKTRVGDASKLRRLTGWEPSLDFEGMIARLVEQRLSGQGG